MPVSPTPKLTEDQWDIVRLFRDHFNLSYRACGAAIGKSESLVKKHLGPLGYEEVKRRRREALDAEQIPGQMEIREVLRVTDHSFTDHPNSGGYCVHIRDVYNDNTCGRSRSDHKETPDQTTIEGILGDVD